MGEEPQPVEPTAATPQAEPVPLVSQPAQTSPAEAPSAKLEPGQIKCPYCEFVSYKVGTITFHKQRIHKKQFDIERANMPRDYKCKECPEAFTSKWALIRHCADLHPKHKKHTRTNEPQVPKIISPKEANTMADEDDDDDEEPESKDKQEPDDYVSEPLFKGPAADAADRRKRLESIVKVLPGLDAKKRDYILYIFDITPNLQSDANAMYRFLLDVRGMEHNVAQRIVDATFGVTTTGAQPQGYIPTYGAPGYPQPYQPYGYPQQYGQQPGYPQQPGFPPYTPPVDVEAAIRRARQEWDREKESEDTKGALQQLTDEIKKLKEPKAAREGYIVIRKQLLNADGTPAMNQDGTPAVQEMEVPPSQAAQFGAVSNAPPPVDPSVMLLKGLEFAKSQVPPPDPMQRQLVEKMAQMEKELADAKLHNVQEGMRVEFNSKLDALTKALELEKDKQKTLEQLSQKFATQQGEKKMSDEATVAITEIQNQTSLAVAGLTNLNHTLSTLIQTFGRANQTIPEGVQGPSEAERERMRREFGGDAV